MKKIVIIILVLSFSIVGANIMYRASDIEFLSSYTDKTNVQDALNELYEKNNKKVIYSFSMCVSQNASTSNGLIVLPEVGSHHAVNLNYYTANYLDEDYVLFENNYLALPKGKYLFSSLVPVRNSTYGTGYKVYDTNNNLILDHSYSGTTLDYAKTVINLESDTNIVVKWYRTNIGWYDVTQYTIERIE